MSSYGKCRILIVTKKRVIFGCVEQRTSIRGL